MSDFLEQFEKRRAERLAADRSFVLAGETLVHRPSVPPRVGVALEEARGRVGVELLEIRQAAQKMNGDVPDELVRMLRGQTSDLDILQVADETIVACLEPESHEAWGRLRAEDAEYPLTIKDVMEIADYLIERVTGIPTDAPAGSSAGRETTPPSKDPSSSAVKSRRR